MCGACLASLSLGSGWAGVRGRLPGGPAGSGGAGGVGDMLDDLEWPSLGTRRGQSSLTFFYRIHSGTEDLDKDKCLTPAPGLGGTKASHGSQCTRYFAYSDALKKFFFPQDYPYVE